MKYDKESAGRIALLALLALIMAVGLWHGRPMAVASACGSADWAQVAAFDVELLPEEGEAAAYHLAAGDPLTEELVAVLESFYCTRQFSDQIPIDRGEKNVVTFSGGADLTLRFQWEGEDYALLLTNEALFVRQGELQRSYMPLRRAEPRQEILALFQEV